MKGGGRTVSIYLSSDLYAAVERARKQTGQRSFSRTLAGLVESALKLRANNRKRRGAKEGIVRTVYL